MGELLTLSPLLQAFLASVMTWALTALGAALVLMLRRTHPITLDAMLAFGAGVMLSASCWSLLTPAIELSATLSQTPFLVTAIGFLCGGSLLLAADAALSRRLPAAAHTDSRRRVALLISSITLHNIPEGLAVGVSFGMLATHPSSAALTAAWMLAVGVALQNFPEGAAVSLPLRREGMSKPAAFFWGQASALVEPLFAVIGAALSVCVRPLLPFALSFAAGAMVCVVIGELVPEVQRSLHPRAMTLFALLGFAIMMILDIALG